MKPFKSAYTHLMDKTKVEKKVKPVSTVTHELPELSVIARRPAKKPETKKEIPEVDKSKTYTPSGSGGWTYHSGPDKWRHNITGKELHPDEYEKKFPGQLRQANYRKLYK